MNRPGRWVRKIRGLPALAVGYAALSFEVASVCSARTVAGTEPFSGLREYLTAFGFMTAAFWLVLLSPGVLLILLFALSARLPRIHMGWRLRAFLLSPVVMLVPVVAWSVMAALVEASREHVEFYGPEGKPEWLGARLVAFLGNEVWLWLWLAVPCLQAITLLVTRCEGRGDAEDNRR